MRQAGPVSRAASVTGISARLLNTLKINFAIAWKNLSPASWDPTIEIPELKIYHVILIAGPTLSRQKSSLQSEMPHHKIDISPSK